VKVLKEGRTLYPGEEGRMCADTLVPLYGTTRFMVVSIRILQTLGLLGPV